VEQWGRWSGRDRDGTSLELDVVARLLDGRLLTGSAKVRSRKADARMILEHVSGLERLAGSGRAWAREALDGASPMLFVSTAGFKDSFREASADLGHPVILWTIDDLF
jgi:hypothetical protein